MASEVIQSSISYSSWKIFSLILGTFAWIINAKLLGPEKFGIWQSATIVLSYLPFLNLGIDHGANREIPLWRGAKEYDTITKVKNLYFSVAFFLALISSIGVVAFSFLLPLNMLLRISLIIVAILGVVASIGRWGIILLKADNKFNIAGLAESADSLGRFLACPLIFLLGLPGMWIGTMAGTSITAFIALKSNHFRPRFFWDNDIFRRLIKFGIPIMCVSIVQILSTNGDKMLVLSFLGTSTLGIYGLGRSFTQLLFVTGGVIGPVLYPRITERYGQTNDPSSLRNLVLFPTMAMGSFIPLFLGFAWFGISVLIKWILPEFFSGIFSSQILFIATAYFLVNGSADYLLVSLNHQILSLIIFSTSVGLGLLLEYISLKLGLGLVGVSMGVAISNFVYSVVIITVALYYTNARIKLITKQIFWAVFPITIATILCLIIQYFFPFKKNSALFPDIINMLIKGTTVFILIIPFAIIMYRKIFSKKA